MEKLVQRRLDIPGTYNLRDVGGYTTADGRTTRWRTVLRSDGLHDVAPRDQALLLQHGLKTVIDMRYTDEVQKQPNPFATSSDVTYHNISLLDGLSELAAGYKLDDTGKIYMAALDLCQPRLKLVLDVITAQGGLPVLVHCTAGKDRTGIVVALLLALARVPQETIVEDYAISVEHLRPLRVRFGELIAEPQAMAAMLQHLDTAYGGIDNYLRLVGLTTDQLDYLRASLVE